ncbi:hypothetical protein WME90_35250 [Sorangium sp. So ce375]|uniref:5'-methylthioadenosine/S-adenosylhomocysteine nucleosidase family protein n=1 Tax=Sorangium sp. So ce375 TaxID=3133306 RepID=UPI003F5C123A
MALSDACFDFLEAVGRAARELAEAVHFYSAPDHPLRYGDEIDALRRACLAVAASPYDAEGGAQLLRLATAVMRYHDTPAGSTASPDHQAKAQNLVNLLQSRVDVWDVAAIPSIVEHVLRETPFTERAARRLGAILPTLPKPDGESIAGVIAKIGASTAKKALGLEENLTTLAQRQVDVGILTIKDEEFEAVLQAFPDGSDVYVSPATHRHYNMRITEAAGGATYRVAIMRQSEQGNGEAQSAARDLIEDLSPRLILVVGIAGALPSKDVTLGDVVLSLRVHDYTVEARHESHDPTYAMAGGPVGKRIEHHVANLRARSQDIGDWTKGLPERPSVLVEDGDLYGPADWNNNVRESLEYHFASKTRPPKFCSGVIASSDRLIKDTRILIPWLQTARHLLAVEMESGGVYRAARERCAMLAIRGISDVVGFRRDEQWTRYACASAAAFARAYLRTEPIEPGKRSHESVVNTPFEETGCRKA